MVKTLNTTSRKTRIETANHLKNNESYKRFKHHFQKNKD